MSDAKEIKRILLEKDISQAELASKLGISAPNLNAKLKRDKFKTFELRAIAEALDCDLRIQYIDKDTNEPI